MELTGNVQGLIDLVGGGVQDVRVDGVSVVNEQNVAEITLPDAPVQGVEVDGVNVVNEQGIAEITLPDAGVHYSTNEQVIGTWINGKPLYQKTLVFYNSYNGDYNDIPININNIDAICHSTAFALSSGSYIPLNFTNKNENNNACAYYFNSAKTGVNFRFGIVLNNITITMQYTKTTDIS